MEKVLVTGGAGYIGSHACKALALAGYEPVTYDNLVYGHRWAVQWGPFEEGDIQDREKLKAVLKAYSPTAVMHFAAFAYVGESVTHPAKYYQNNVGGTLTLLDAMRQQGVNRIVFSSTCATYGVPTEIPISDRHTQAPINPYGRSKLMIEHILRDYVQAYGLSAVSLRYFNAAGADPEGTIGESHDPETHLIPNVLRTAKGELPHVSIYGDDYDTFDGTCVRDYIHVTDLADAHVRALQYLTEHGGYHTYNLGTETGNSVKEILSTAEAVIGRKIPARIAPRRPGDPPILVANARRAKHALNWQPTYTTITQIIETAWNWELSKPVGSQ